MANASAMPVAAIYNFAQWLPSSGASGIIVRMGRQPTLHCIVSTTPSEAFPITPLPAPSPTYFETRVLPSASHLALYPLKLMLGLLGHLVLCPCYVLVWTLIGSSY